MVKVLGCRDVGIDCDYVVRGENVEEVLVKAKEHAREAHNLTEFDDEKLKEVMRDEE